MSIARGQVSPFEKSAASLELKPVDGSVTGAVSLKETRDGLMVAARFSGKPNWARSATEMNDRDHVDIWLRAAANVQMP
jgi:hypothetical protein